MSIALSLHVITSVVILGATSQAATDYGYTVIEDFASGAYEGWEATGEAFGKAPTEKDMVGSLEGAYAADGCSRAANERKERP